ncbi:hypothetical protein [Sphingomonas sp.]|uniref:hypothetical protein n=1 Tax=Sphingomonas sp. TaxID=28214 RepID=UPI001EB5EF3F|nr:hypothetical protein [Sphingomonas sp.]MBX3594066.1 hypothetical protein [Sphingomonas sp.]
MKLVSKAALVAAMAVTAPALLVATPAAAQKKKGDEGPQLKVSAEFRKAATEVETLIKAKDYQTAATKLDALDALAQNDDEKFYAANFRLQTAANLKDNAGMLRALDVLIANPNTPQADRGRFNFFRGDLTLQQATDAPSKQRKSAEAIPYFEKARELGYVPQGSSMDLQLARIQFDAGQVAPAVANLESAVKAEIAAGRKPPEAWYKLATSRLYQSGDRAGASKWLSMQLAAYPTPETWRSSLMVFMEQEKAKGVTLDADQRLDVLRLLRATKALAGESDYFDYADAAQRRGLPWEAKAVIEEGRAANKISTSSTTLNQIYAQAVGREKAEVPLAGEEKKAAAAARGDLAMQTADAYLASRNLPKAIELYRMALQKGGVDTNLVNTRLGIALALSGQKAEAKTAFAAVTGSPRADIARFWTTYVDQSGS